MGRHLSTPRHLASAGISNLSDLSSVDGCCSTDLPTVIELLGFRFCLLELFDMLLRTLGLKSVSPPSLDPGNEEEKMVNFFQSECIIFDLKILID